MRRLQELWRWLERINSVWSVLERLVVVGVLIAVGTGAVALAIWRNPQSAGITAAALVGVTWLVMLIAVGLHHRHARQRARKSRPPTSTSRPTLYDELWHVEMSKEDRKRADEIAELEYIQDLREELDETSPQSSSHRIDSDRADSGELQDVRETIQRLRASTETLNFEATDRAWLLLRLKDRLAGAGIDSRTFVRVSDELGLGVVEWRSLMAQYHREGIVEPEHHSGATPDTHGMLKSGWASSWDLWRITPFGAAILRELERNPPPSPRPIFEEDS